MFFRFSRKACFCDFRAFFLPKIIQKPFQNEVRTLQKSMLKTHCFLTSLFFGFRPSQSSFWEGFRWLLGASGSLWGASWAPLGHSWAPLGRSWAPLGRAFFKHWSQIGSRFPPRALLDRFGVAGGGVLEGFGWDLGKDLGYMQYTQYIQCMQYMQYRRCMQYMLHMQLAE